MSHLRDQHYTAWPLVEGYCGAQSYEAGAVVELHASARCATFAVVVSRVGAEPVEVWRRENCRADDHGVPAEAWAVGCDWPVAVAIPTEASWPSGFYEVRMEADAPPARDDDRRGVAHAFFVLRPAPAAASDRPLLVLGTNTWQAYNQWGGRCLYTGAHQVSFARPLERGYLWRPSAPGDVVYDGRVQPVGPVHDREHRQLQSYLADNDYPMWCASSGWHTYEHRFVRWAERSGLPLDVAVSADLDDPARAAELLTGRRLLVSAGHDEYWSAPMRDATDHFVDQGGNWAVFSGNTCFWQVRVADDGRSLVCHKGRARLDDPVAGTDQAHLLTSMWSDPLIGRPETSTIGLTFSRGGYHRVGDAVADGTGGYRVHRPEHWAFTGTGVVEGDLVGSDAQVVGYETDGCALDWSTGQPVPTGVDGAPVHGEVLATAPARLVSITPERCEAPEALWASVKPPGDLEGTAMVLFGGQWRERISEIEQGHAVMMTFSRGRGRVFNAGTTDWVFGLDTDPTVAAITRNVLRELG
ncbi:MAG: N,N-dimethylformamidase beta subunit family domain-containing protein [Actinomycetota bacterium]